MDLGFSTAGRPSSSGFGPPQIHWEDCAAHWIVLCLRSVQDDAGMPQRLVHPHVKRIHSQNLAKGIEWIDTAIYGCSRPVTEYCFNAYETSRVLTCACHAWKVCGEQGLHAQESVLKHLLEIGITLENLRTAPQGSLLNAKAVDEALRFFVRVKEFELKEGRYQNPWGLMR
jgi:hypothetical protein